MDSELLPPVLMTTVTALTGLVYAFKRRSAGTSAALTAGCSVWSGAQVLIFMAPHTVATAAMRLQGKTKGVGTNIAKIAGVDYDFRLYSLVLVGLLFVLQAVYILRSSRAASEGDLAASKRIRRSVVNVLLLAVPLAPLSPGIPFLTAPAVLALIMQYRLFAQVGRSSAPASRTQVAAA